METKVKLITPEVAEFLLKKNSMNRAIKPHVVQEYIRQMKNGLWMENTGEPIILASDGDILNGQHRLQAIVQSGKSYNILVVEGIKKEVFSVIDTHAKRTPGDALHIDGVVTDSNAIAKGIKTYWNYKLGRMIAGESRSISNQEIVNIYNKRPKYWDSCNTMAGGWYRSSHLLSIGEYIGLFAYLDEFDGSDSFNFISKFTEGTNLSKGNPIYVLREKLSSIRMNGKMVRPAVKTAFIFKAWNAYRDGKPINVLRFNPTDEKYPVAK